MKRLALIALLSTSISAWSETLTIRADEWFPMNGDPDSSNPGYMIDFAKAVFEPKGIKVDYALMPWKRALYEVRKGNNDCVVGAYESEAPGFLFPDEHWGWDVQKFYVAKGDSWRYSNLESLASRKVGVVHGYAYGEPFDAYAAKLKDKSIFSVSGNHALEKNIKKLLANRIDTVLETAAVFEAKLKEMGVQGQAVAVGQLLEPTPLYIACSPETTTGKRYIKMLNEAMPKLKANGKLKAILDKYGLQSW